MYNISKKSCTGCLVEKPLAASFSNQHSIFDSSGLGLAFLLWFASPHPLLYEAKNHAKY